MKAVAVALAGLAIVVGCGESGSPATPTPPAIAVAAPAAPATAARGEVVGRRRREAPAELVLDADAAAMAAAPMTARIVEVHVRPGDRVAAGAPLVTLVMPEAAIEAARVIGANDQLTTLDARRQALTTLLADGLARASDLAEIDARMAALRAERGQAVATLRAAGLGDPSTVARAGGRLTLRASAASVVAEVTAVAGEVRDPADRPLVRLLAGSARRVAARWATAPEDGAATLVLADGSHRALTVVASAPGHDGAAVAVWYEVAGAPLPATARGRVVLEVAP